MAHQLLDDTMFYVGDTPWHKLGIKLEKPPSIQSALVQGNLDWRVQKIPTYYDVSDDHGMPYMKCETGYYVTIKQDTNTPLGNVSAKYEVLQNTDAFEPFEILLDKGYALETAGAVDEGRKVWILAKKPSTVKIGDDELLQYALLMNSHDGSTPVYLQPTDVRVVCANTLNWALDKKSDMRFSIRHTTGVNDRLKQVSGILKDADANWSRAHEIMKRMHEHKIDEKQAEAYFEVVIPYLRNRGLSGKNNLGVTHRDFATPVFNQLKSNFKSGRGNKGETLWDAYNAVTEYFDHQKNHKDWVKGTQFGVAAMYKRDAFLYGKRIVSDKTSAGITIA
jgi:phage/plasmid-like protein (TIGR03299 family)